MARRKRQYGRLTKKIARASAVDALRAMRLGERYVKLRLNEGDCVGALFGVVDMSRDAGAAAAYRYEGGKSSRRDPAHTRVGKVAGKVARECGLPHHWNQWKK